MKKTAKHYGKATLSAVAGLTMVVSMSAGSALAAATPAQEQAATTGNDSTAAPHTTTVTSSQILMDAAIGKFTYDQTTLTPNAEIAHFFQRISQAICGSNGNFTAENPLGWQLSVSGDVGNAFTESVGDLAGEESTNKVMTCTCGGNPAGGRAIITADVKGIPIDHLLARAQADTGANTLTFVSSDGTEVAFPLAYVIGHHAVLSYEINDEDLSASVGGNNQLWMMKTPANYFVRDVVSIVVSSQEVVPAAPGATDEHPNSPNAGVLAAIQE